MSGTIISGLIKSVAEEPTDGLIKVTTRHYDPESSPPVMTSEEVTWRNDL